MLVEKKFGVPLHVRKCEVRMVGSDIGQVLFMGVYGPGLQSRAP